MTWVHNATVDIENASRYPAVIGVSVTFCALMLAVVVTRGLFRRAILGWDDLAIFVTAVSPALTQVHFHRLLTYRPLDIQCGLHSDVRDPDALGSWTACQRSSEAGRTYLQGGKS